MNLSVTIPTFQPTHYLLDTLESICTAAREMPENVDVYLCLNGPVSNNEVVDTILENVYEHINLIVISSLKVNEPNESLNFAIHQANSTYTWVMSDDDLILENGLIKVSSVLEPEKIDIAIANFITIDSQGLKIIENAQGWRNDRYFGPEEIDVSIAESNFCFGTFSSLIVNKKKWEETDYYNTKVANDMNFMCQIPELMSKGEHAFIAEPIYAYRMYEKRWQTDYNSTFEIDHVILPQIINQYRNFQISEEVRSVLACRNQKGILQSLYNLRLYGKLELRLIYKFMQYNYPVFSAYGIFVIFFLPKRLFKLLGNLSFLQKYKRRL